MKRIVCALFLSQVLTLALWTSLAFLDTGRSRANSDQKVNLSLGELQTLVHALVKEDLETALKAARATTPAVPADGERRGVASSSTLVTTGSAFDQRGTFVPYCSIGGCLDGAHMFAQNLMDTETRLDASAQEVGLALNFNDKTGRAETWSPNTTYKVGDEERVPNSHCITYQNDIASTMPVCIYKVIAAGTSGITGPTGNGADIRDGTVRWTYLGAGLNDGKSALSVAMTMRPGAGSGWSFVTDLGVGPVGNVSALGYEEDCNNGNKDSYAGSPFFMTCFFQGGGGPGTFPMLAYRYVGSGAVPTGGFGAHYGDFYSGQPGETGSVVKDAVWVDATNASTSLEALAGRNHAKAFLSDESDSSTVLLASGHHNEGLDLMGATFASGNSMMIPNGTFIAWSGTKNLMGHNSVTGALTYGATNNGTQWNLASYDNGDLGIAGHLFSRGPAPRLVGCGTGATLARGSTDLGGLVTEGKPNVEDCHLTWTRSYDRSPVCIIVALDNQKTPIKTFRANADGLTYSHSPAAGASFAYQCQGE